MAPFAQKRLPAHLKPDAKHPGGRPTEYREEYCDLVRQDMSNGVSLTAFAGLIGVSRESVYEWISRHSEFADAVARGRAARCRVLELKLLSARYGAQCSAAIFALKNAQPDEWRDLKHMETTHLHAIAQLTDAQLMAIAQGMHGSSVEDAIEGTCERLDPRQPNER